MLQALAPFYANDITRRVGMAFTAEEDLWLRYRLDVFDQQSRFVEWISFDV